MGLALAVVVIVAGVVILATSGPGTRTGASVPEELPSSPDTGAPPVVSAETLGELVPGFQGQIRGAAIGESSQPLAWTWASGDTAPRVVSLPGIGTGQGAWDATVERFAAISTVAAGGPALYFGPPSDIRLVTNGATSFAWHDDRPGEIAYLLEPQADGLTELWRSLPVSRDLASRTFTSTRVARLQFDARLVAFGDWGFALTDFSNQLDRGLLITLDPEGGLIAQAPLEFIDSAAGGRLLVASNVGEEDSELAVVGTNLGPNEALLLLGATDGVLSPDAGWVAQYAKERSILEVSELGGPQRFSVDLSVGDAELMHWSADLRWVLLVGFETAEFQDTLLFADLRDREVHSVPLPEGVIQWGAASGLAIDATGEGAPPLIFEN